ncbi:hypothetical protein [Nonomuraea phyllanthi]|uniref:hypothetical protein n=1 Tax=Nonomuraea phyllanthi TaxID=2219224 RepID=UPI001D134389|nr:hypothetical protein [Nonomuraea phyllanthi]
MFVLRTAVLIAATMTTGLVAGVCGLNQHTIMRGLARTDDHTFVSAFQAIDRAISNAWFMIGFMGALVFTGLATVLHLAQDVRSVLPWLIVAFAPLPGHLRPHDGRQRAAQRGHQGSRRSGRDRGPR